MREELRRMQQRHAVIGEVRGGQGLFAVIELVREPLAPWPQPHSALDLLDRLLGELAVAVGGTRS
jgi:taurine--2-oxoglutarate transaminase